MKILKAYKNFHVAVIFVLFYQGVLLASLNLHPKLDYAISFLLYFLVFIFYSNRIFLINRWLFYSIIVVTPSLLVGILLGWDYIDIAADVARYLAPFLGYTAGILLLNQLEYYRILYVLYGLLALQILSFYDSVFSKISHVFGGGPLVEYSNYGLEVSSLYFFLSYFLLKNKIALGFKKILLISYVIGFIISPILLMSKARTLTMVFSFIFIFIFYSNLRSKLKMLLLTAIMIISSFLFFNERTFNSQTAFDYNVFSRFQDTIELFKTDDYSADASTSFRVSEIVNVTKTLVNTSPYSLPFGLGSGSLYYDKYSQILGGISKENYRPDGGIHDIFAIPFAYLFRYGFIGLLFMAFFIVHIYRKIKVDNLNAHQDTIAASLKLYIIISLIADLFVPVHVYGNPQFGFIIALGIIMQNKLKGQYNSLNNSAI